MRLAYIIKECQNNNFTRSVSQKDLSRQSSRARNICNIKFCENRLNGFRYLRELCSWTDRQTDNPNFYKVETYLNRLFVPKIYILPNVVKIVRVVLEIYVNSILVNLERDRQAGRQTTCLHRLSACLLCNLSGQVAQLRQPVQDMLDRQADNQNFYKIETYLDRLLGPEVYIIPNFVKIVTQFLIFTRVVFTGRQTDNPIFYKIQTYLDRLLVPEIYIIPNFVKIVRAVLEIHVSYVHGQTDRQASRFFTMLRPIQIVFSCLKYT